MKLVLLVRDGVAAKVVTHHIAQHLAPSLIVAESGRPARRRKLRRTLRKGAPFRWPITLLDLVANAIYQQRWSRFLGSYATRVGITDYPGGVPVLDVEDVNEPAAVDAVREQAPDLVIVFGTSILGAQALEAGSRLMLNLHGGVVPQYRNVHSELWAVVNQDRANVGISVLHLDQGIDSGAIAVQKKLPQQADESFFSLRLANLILASECAIEAIDLAVDDHLPAIPQPETPAGYHQTPGVATLSRLAWRQLLRPQAHFTMKPRSEI